MSLLELRKVSMSFGGLKVISDLDLVVNEGEIVSVIGPNGAGKTTIFNLITGVYDPGDGQILLEGRDLCGMPPHKRTKLGISATFQTLRLFLNMTVKENVMAATFCHTRPRVWQSVLRTPFQRREEREVNRLAQENPEFLAQLPFGH